MKKNTLINLLSYFILFNIGITLFNCTTKKEQTFKSDFGSRKARTWVGPEYWTNPMQDWQIRNGELECLVSKPNRNTHILTRKLDKVLGNLTMKVRIKLFDADTTILRENWVGFSIGSKGEFNDYRDSAVFGKGLDIGVTTRGNLFIDKLPEENRVNTEIQKALFNGIILELDLVFSKPNLLFEAGAYRLVVSLKDGQTGKLISTLTKNNVSPEALTGDLVLVSHFNYKGEKANKKSVSFKDWEISGSKVSTHNNYVFGPILFSQYTLSRGTMKLTAQMAPVTVDEEKVELQIKKEGKEWETIKKADIHKHARTATFKVNNWDFKEDIPYRLTYKVDKGANVSKETFYWEGTIRKDPVDKDQIAVAGFTGNDHLGFPNTDITDQIKYQNPDVLFFSGDQLYETSGGFGAQRFPDDKAMLDYLRKWYMYGWAFRDVMKDRPTVSITDDHDVYHGNIWGEGGRDIPDSLGQGSNAQDYGGYKMSPNWVNMVERTQTSHLPDPYDPTPVEQGIGTYYTDMVYGGISFAILEDRKFKSAPKAMLPKADIFNGWTRNKAFNIKKEGDIAGAKMLGERQLLFLENWVSNWDYQAQMKMLLSQTIFANVATLPKAALTDVVVPTLRIMNKGDYPPDDVSVADLDSNGWPQAGRNKAVKIIRKGFVFHLAGDQHLGSTIQYGTDTWNDAGFALCVPSISNHWPRRWYPSVEGQNRDLEQPKYTGEYKDGFGNKMTVHAVSNPTFTNKKPSKLHDRATGYGIVRLNKKSRDITLECWPRFANPKMGNTEQYEGWPITINQVDNYGRKPLGYLPEIKIEGLKNPVIQIINESSKELVYSLRIKEQSFKPKVFNINSTYTVKVGEPDTDTWKEKNSITISDGEINFKF
ncbi:alkaline phosphatase D family protein [Wocania ichthyoenteri]|uniref:alkaline phosphatase D family protein n=1 Tax=Wocania ichthyoenteri TaxID=1230531 RepID=UPI00068E39F2|nr:alkaline phosphatase D family protein [Wocania ichthyoenteri]